MTRRIVDAIWCVVLEIVVSGLSTLLLGALIGSFGVLVAGGAFSALLVTAMVIYAVARRHRPAP